MDLDDEALAAQVADSTGITRNRVRAILADQRQYLERVLRSDGLFFAHQQVMFGKHRSDPLMDYLAGHDDPPIFWEIAESEATEEPRDLDEVVGPDDVVLFDVYGEPRAVVPARFGNGRRLDTIQTAYRVLTEEGGHDGDDVEAVLVAYWELVAQDGRRLTIRWEKWSSEKELEDWLVDNLGVLAEFGLDVRLWSHPATGRSGRQYVFADGTYADLICRTREGDWVVVELKAVEADLRALDQIRGYVRCVKNELADQGQKVKGLVISDGATAEFLTAIGRADEDLYYLTSGDIDGFVQHCWTQSNSQP